MTLRELVEALKALTPSTVFARGFGEPASYRGIYAEVAFAPRRDVSVGDMLRNAYAAIGPVFDGWKGGSYTYGLDTTCHLAEEGECEDSEAAMAELLFKGPLLAEIDSLKARIDKLLLAGLQAEAKLATTLQDRFECVECHALIPSGGEWPSSPHPESSSLCWGCGPGEHRIKELEAECMDAHNLAAEVALGVTHWTHGADEPPCVRCRLEQAEATLAEERKKHPPDWNCDDAADFQQERDEAEARVKELEAWFGQTEALTEILREECSGMRGRVKELETVRRDQAAIICQQRDRADKAERSFRDERRELERLRAVYNRSTSCDISRELDFAEAKLASVWSAGEALAVARWRWCGHSAPDDPLLQAWDRAAGDKP